MLREYNTTVTNVKVLNPPRIDNNFDGSGSFYVSWTFVFEDSFDRIKDICIEVKQIVGKAYVNEWVEEGFIEHEIEVNSKDFKIINKIKITTGVIFPEKMVIDFDTKIITVT